MLGLGPLELIIVVVIAVVVFGPKRFPEVGRAVGEGIRDLRSTITSVDPRDDLKSTLSRADPREELKSTPSSADPRAERDAERRA
jgi:sec-independent protein translocase protein TatA